ncbi:SMP-30/gluconolactonase/LRE family protein [Saccharopolyspora griseoalba]|uniref:SMP-30/gluconolactonase/LRE family protein n=1 Tax=Saccharopolyspora griseoalba TaxID=1431848 RepID=A0ABW2LPE0_9PSEU
MLAQADIALPAAARCGRAPTWDVGTGTLLWTDPPSRTVHRFRPGGGNATMQVPQPAGGAKPRSRGGVVLHLAEGIALFDAHGETRTWLAYWGREGFTGGATLVDRRGRLWASTVRADEGGQGWLVRVGPDGSAGVLLDDLRAGLGLGWSPDDTRLYVADAGTGRVDVLDFDLATGSAGNRRALCEVGGEPAGLAVAADGAIWTAVRDKGELHRYASTGELLDSVPLPAKRPTGLCFGGADLTDLYITTATDDVPEPGEADGALLALRDLPEGLRPHAFTG